MSDPTLAIVVTIAVLTPLVTIIWVNVRIIRRRRKYWERKNWQSGTTGAGGAGYYAEAAAVGGAAAEAIDPPTPRWRRGRS